MEEFTDKNLICYFSWGRREYVEQCFPALLDAVRPQDRLLVVDQEMHNMDYYMQFKDKVDYLIGLKRNYRIGPAWEFFKYLAMWLKIIKHDDVKWSPDYINIVESDALVKKNFISELTPLIKGDVRVASGYMGLKDPNTKFVRRDGKVLYKVGTQGINVICRMEDFLKIYDYPNYTQDHYFSQKIDSRTACLDLVEHIGVKRRKEGFF